MTLIFTDFLEVTTVLSTYSRRHLHDIVSLNVDIPASYPERGRLQAGFPTPRSDMVQLRSPPIPSVQVGVGCDASILSDGPVVSGLQPTLCGVHHTASRPSGLEAPMVMSDLQVFAREFQKSKQNTRN
jgi:hypothetical protein